MKAKQMKMIRNIIMAVSIILGFVFWLLMPNEFKNTAFFHIGNGEYTSKWLALIGLLIPLVALVPDKNREEVHTEDPVERARLLEETALSEAKIQVLVAIFTGLVTVAALGIAAFTL